MGRKPRGRAGSPADDRAEGPGVRRSGPPCPGGPAAGQAVRGCAWPGWAEGPQRQLLPVLRVGDSQAQAAELSGTQDLQHPNTLRADRGAWNWPLRPSPVKVTTVSHGHSARLAGPACEEIQLQGGSGKERCPSGPVSALSHEKPSSVCFRDVHSQAAVPVAHRLYGQRVFISSHPPGVLRVVLAGGSWSSVQTGLVAFAGPSRPKCQLNAWGKVLQKKARSQESLSLHPVLTWLQRNPVAW